MAAARRFGLENSKTRAALLDAAEQLMREEGYAAVTSRRIAAKAGLKPQLVHYYFRTMDELFLALLKDRMARNLEHYRRALESPQPIRALWELNANPEGTALILEFSALANHRKAIRAEIAQHAETMRSMQAEALAQAFAQRKFEPSDLPAVVGSLLMTSVSRTIVLEVALGISGGHAETLALVERYLQQIEPSEATPALRGGSRG